MSSNIEYWAQLRNETKGKCFFILSCARSGSTSLTKILDAADNATCLIEPYPNLNFETREMMEGRIDDPYDVLESTVIKRIKDNIKKNMIYGEKNLTYGPFIPHLFEMLHCKFVFIKRDGRDVVRSLMDWHEKVFGSIYRECIEPGYLSSRAIKSAANLPIHLDTSDYSRPRPQPGDNLYEEWEWLTREEMCAYYWSYINELYLDELKKIPKEYWIEIDYTSPTVDDILRVIDFLGLKGISNNCVQNMLSKKINSLKDRFGEDTSYPNWVEWSIAHKNRFDKIASGTMYRLGYYSKKYEFTGRKYND